MPIFRTHSFDGLTGEQCTGTVEAPSLQHVECMNIAHFEVWDEPYYDVVDPDPVSEPHSEYHDQLGSAEWRIYAEEYGHLMQDFACTMPRPRVPRRRALRNGA